jgi:hypothetical protein
MKRRTFLKMASGGLLVTVPIGTVGCSNPTPEDIDGEITACEHDWFNGAGGEVRCRRCGMYRAKSNGDDAANVDEDEATDDSKSTTGKP